MTARRAGRPRSGVPNASPGSAARRPGRILALGASLAVVSGIVPTVVAGVVLGPIGCAGAPWLLGEPLDGKPSIPSTSRAETVADHRRKLGDARRRQEKVTEIAELSALEQRGALGVAETSRFVDLLKERARDWIALERPIPLVDDLRHIVALDPARERSLGVALRNAERAAGDLWLALGENTRAEAEYRRAERLGAPRMVFRLRAAWGASPADLDGEILEQALAELPDRVLAPFTIAYLASGAAKPPLLRKALRAARVYGPVDIENRIEALPMAATFKTDLVAGVTRDLGHDGVSGDERERSPRAGAAPAPATLVEPGPDDRLYGGVTLARALLPLYDAFPELVAPGPRSRAWSDLLVAEDPTSPDSLELAALIDARAGRLEGAARKMGDLVFYSPDRAAAYGRVARVWERSGQERRACLAWERATHFGPVDDPRWCDLVACLRRNPRAGDVAAVERFTRERSPLLTCAADAGTVPVDAGTSDIPAGEARDAGVTDAAAAWHGGSSD